MGKKILIIDDSRTARLFIRQSFEITGFSGCEFLEASHGDEALKLMRQNTGIALVITDINMPIKDGITMLKEMRLEEALKLIPVLVITSTQNPARQAELEPYRVEGILAKPLHLPQVAPALIAIKERLGI